MMSSKTVLFNVDCISLIKDINNKWFYIIKRSKFVESFQGISQMGNASIFL